jgi:hypothetical protein
MRTACALLVAMVAPLVQAAPCAVESPQHTVALVELYTSQGCSSCPPADRWLSGLGERGYAPARVVPLSLHVDYWDYLGWKDPYAQSRFASRQRNLTQLQRLALVYTPQVLLQGRDFRGWRNPEAFDAALRQINAMPAGADLALRIHSVDPDAIEVGWDARLHDASLGKEMGLYVAAYENRLGGQVTAGENGGRLLRHDFVVLAWQGPLPFDRDGRSAETRRIPLLPKAIAAHSGVAAFVQNRRTVEVLQALMLPVCETPGR